MAQLVHVLARYNSSKVNFKDKGLSTRGRVVREGNSGSLGALGVGDRVGNGFPRRYI